MKSLTEELQAQHDEILKASQGRRQELLQQAASIGTQSLEKLLTTTRRTSLNSVLPKHLSIADFADATIEADVEFAAARMDQCAQCPPHGGACASPDQEQKPGMFPRWQEGFVYVRCVRYREYLLRTQLQAAGVPVDLLGKSFEAYQPATDQQEMALALTSAISAAALPRGMMLIGATGLGKSHLAAAMLREQFSRRLIRSAMMIYVPTLIHQIDHRRNYDEREQLIQRAIACDLLVLDDLGAEATTSYQQQYLTMIITEREANGRPLVVTSNHELGHFKKTLGDRAYSRLVAMLRVVLLEGTDYRCR